MSASGSVQVTLPASLDAASRARLWAADFLGETDHTEFRDEALLLISELVTNAVKYGGGTAIQVSAEETERGGVRFAAVDDSPAVPAVRNLTTTSLFGRGMWLIANLAAEWGAEVSPDRSGKTVWFTLQ